MVLFGLGMGSQESIMRALVADIAPMGCRATAYGYYNTIFGSFWFAGSVILGIIYDFSIPVMIIMSIGLQLISIPLLLMFFRAKKD
jgi:MFS family permease